MLVNDDFTTISGLANGIDTHAHKTAIQDGGKTIAVLGTPLNKYYPRENKGTIKVCVGRGLGRRGRIEWLL